MDEQMEEVRRRSDVCNSKVRTLEEERKALLTRLSEVTRTIQEQQETGRECTKLLKLLEEEKVNRSKEIETRIAQAFVRQKESTDEKLATVSVLSGLHEAADLTGRERSSLVDDMGKRCKASVQALAQVAAKHWESEANVVSALAAVHGQDSTAVEKKWAAVENLAEKVVPLLDQQQGGGGGALSSAPGTQTA